MIIVMSLINFDINISILLRFFLLVYMMKNYCCTIWNI
jgi:hypothetical protein